MVQNTQPELLTDTALASFLQVSHSTLFRYFKKPGFPRPLQVGKSRRWQRAEIIEYFRNGGMAEKAAE